MNETKDYELKIGAVYSVVADGDEVSGVFRGYTMIGSETALVMEDDDGTVYVPSASIILMRLVRQAPEDKPESPKDVYYG